MKIDKQNQTNIITDKLQKYPYMIIAILGLLSYFQVVTYGYVNFDDDMQIKGNIEKLQNINNLGEAFLTDSFFTKGGYYYRPMMNATFLLDAQVSGESPWMYHTSALLLHILTALVLFSLLLNLNYARLPSLFWASIFVISPVYSNAVGWLPARNDLLMGLFALLAFINYLKFQSHGKPLHFGFHILFIMGAFMSKEIAFLLTLVFVFHTFLFNKNDLFSKRNFTIYFAWVALLLIWLYMRSFSIEGELSRFDPMGVKQFLMNLPFIPEIIAKFIFPFFVTVMPTFTIHITAIGIVLILGIIYYTIKNKDRRIKYIIFAAMFFFLFATPGLIFRYPTAKDYFEYFEARAYLPLFGLIFLFIELVPKKFYNLSGNVNRLIIAGIIILLIGINYWKLPNYNDPLSFWKAAVKHNPDRSLFNFHLGRNLIRFNKPEIAEKFMLRSLKLNPNIPEANYEIGHFYFKKEEYSKAIPYFLNVLKKEKLYLRIIELKPFVRNSYFSIAASYYYLKQSDKAIEYYRSALRKWPQNKQIIENLMKIHVLSNQYEPAINLAKYYVSLENDPSSISQIYNQWANYEFINRRYKQAVKHLDSAMAYNPNSPLLLTNKGRSLASLGKTQDAFLLWNKAIKLNPEFTPAYELIANYYKNVEKNEVKAKDIMKKLKSLSKIPKGQ